MLKSDIHEKYNNKNVKISFQKFEKYKILYNI